MKILKSIFTLSLLLTMFCASAQTRFAQKDKDEFIQDLKKEMAVYKAETKKPIKLAELKEDLFHKIAELRADKHISYHEERRVMERFNDLVAQAKTKQIDEEKAIFEIIDQELKVIDVKPLQCIKEGNTCNDFSCCDGLVCAAEPKRDFGNNKCVAQGNSCNKDSECCSGECEEDKNTKKKICLEVKRCFRPLNVGQRCNDNPVCGQGECLPFDTATSGYLAATKVGDKCKSDKQCKSNFCDGGICRESRVCKECTKLGNKVERGLKCCEGLIPNAAGRCIPDAPPIVLPQVNNSKPAFLKQKLISLMSLLVSPTLANDADNAALGVIQRAANNSESERDVGISTSLTQDPKSKVYAEPIAKSHVNARFKEYTKSDFKTCNIDFKADYYNYMMAKENRPGAGESATGSMFDYQTTLLAFEFVSQGEENYDDYWTNGTDGGSIHKRLKNISDASSKVRRGTEQKLIEYNRKLTCLCLETMGPKGIGFDKELESLVKYKIDKKDGKKASLPKLSASTLKILCGGEEKDSICSQYAVDNTSSPKFSEYKESLISSAPDKATYYANYCEEERNAYAALIKDIDTMSGFENLKDEGEGDASGVKGSRMLVYWTKTLADFNMELSIDNGSLFGKFADVYKWYENQTSNDKWGQARIDKKDLFVIDVLDNNNHRVYSMAAAVIAATLTVGAIAVIGGMSIPAIITSWTAIGVIVASAAAGGGAGYVVATLRGAWISKTPFIEDKKMYSYNCGSKKNPKSCTKYTRILKYPYSEVCHARISSNACIKHFVATNDEVGNDIFVIDPWIPVGMKKSDIIRDQVTLVQRLDQGFENGLGMLLPRDPGGRQSEEYRVTPFLTTVYAGYFAPKLVPEYKQNYAITSDIEKKIKQKAKEFAIKEKFFYAEEEEQLKRFADYSFDYHFVWAKTSQQNIVAYPQPHFMTYLDLMSAGVAGKLAVGNADNANKLRNLNTKYLANYKKVLSTYRDKAVSGSRTKTVAWIDKELKAITNMEAESAMIDSALKLGSNSGQGATFGANSANFQGSNVATTGNGTAASFVATVKKLREAREEQLKKLDNFNKNVGADSERGKALLSAQAATVTKFSIPTSGNVKSVARSLFNTSSGSETLGNKEQESGYNSGGVGNLSNVKVDNSGYMTGGEYGSSGSSAKSTSSQAGADGEAVSAVSAEETSRIQGAIDARDKNGKAEYETADTDDLWERITKTYIRNYEKVLNKRKKDKDFLETNKN